MEFSRRDFVSTGLAGAAGVLASTATAVHLSAAPPQLADEDGYKLWLRFAPPGDAATQYRQAIRQIVVAGTSPTSRIIRDEMTAGDDSDVRQRRARIDGRAIARHVIVGTPKNSAADSRSRSGMPNWRSSVQKGIASRTVRVGESAGGRRRLRRARSVRSTARITSCGCCRPAADRQAGHHGASEGSAPDAEPLGQHGRVRSSAATPADRSGSGASYPARSARATLTMRGRTRRSASTARSSTASTPTPHPDAGVPARRWRPSRTCGGRTVCACTCLPNFAAPIRLGGLKTADPLDPGVIAWWKAKAERDLQADSRLRRVSRQGKFGRAARSQGLRPQSRGGRELPRRRRRRTRRQRHLAGVHLRRRRRSRSRQACLHRVHEARRAVQAERPRPGQERRHRLHAARAVPSALRRAEQDAGRRRDPGDPGVPGPGQTPRLSRYDVGGVSRGGHVREGQGINSREGLEGDVIPQRVTGIVSVLNPGLDRNWCGHHFSQSNWYASGTAGVEP